MFDDNFSFLSSTSGAYSCVSNDTVASSPDISPFSSRCSSPLPQRVPQTVAPSSLAFRPRDNRFNFQSSLTALNLPRHPSITALTADLQSHVLESPSDLSTPPSPYSNVSTPNTEMDDLNEGFAEPNQHSTSSSISGNVVEPSLWDLTMAAKRNPTSFPSPDSASLAPSFSLRRQQRQALVRLQCLARRAPDLAMLVEECHPSSLPMMEGSGREKSISGVSGRIVKERSNSHNAGVVKRLPKIRKKATR